MASRSRPLLSFAAAALLLALAAPRASARARVSYAALATEAAENGLQIAPVDPNVLRDGAPAMEQLFLAANTTFSYHMSMRDLSFVRDRVSTVLLEKWTQPKMRELFLVPNYPCPTAARVGEWGEGGKWLCNFFPFRGAFKRSAVKPSPTLGEGPDDNPGFAQRLAPWRTAVVYSVGSRDETSFELAMHRLLGVKPHTFDPTLPEAKQAHMEGLPFCHFHNIGLKGRGRARAGRNWGRLMRITEVMEMLQHKYVDVLKIDCEGCEVSVMNDLLNTFGRQPPVGQVLMEIHHLVAPRSEIDLLLTMEKLGFRMFHSENNERYLKAHEVAYVHESLVDPAFWP